LFDWKKSLGGVKDQLLYPNPTYRILTMGLLAIEGKKYDEIFEHADKILKDDPSNVDAMVYKALSLEQLGKFEQGESLFLLALSLEPKKIQLLEMRISSLLLLEKYEETLAYFDRILEIEPKRIKALEIKSTSLENLGRFSESITCYDKILEIDPKNKQAIKKREVCRSKMS